MKHNIGLPEMIGDKKIIITGERLTLKWIGKRILVWSRLDEEKDLIYEKSKEKGL